MEMVEGGDRRCEMSLGMIQLLDVTCYFFYLHIQNKTFSVK